MCGFAGILANRKKSHTRRRPSPPCPLSLLSVGENRAWLPPLLLLGEGGWGGEGHLMCDPSTSLRACFFRLAYFEKRGPFAEARNRGQVAGDGSTVHTQ